MNKLLYSIFLFSATILNANAQVQKTKYTPKLLQLSTRISFIGGCINAEYRLNPNLVLSQDLGAQIAFIPTAYNNRYNNNYAAYNEPTVDDIGLDIGAFWASFYSSTILKLVINSSSKKQYNSSPYANTFKYVGLAFNVNSPSIFKAPGWENNPYSFREAYKSLFIAGRQMEIGKEGLRSVDFRVGMGTAYNYNFKQIDFAFTVNVIVGLNFYKINH